MARYIDADKAKHEFNIGFGGVSHAVIANQIIDSIPTADVVEVKHGEWKVTVIEKSETVFRTGAPHCNLCKMTATHRYKYCPHCGAKMDGERRDT